MSQTSAENLMIFLQSKFTSVGMVLINNENDLVKIKDFRPDLVFLTMKYLPIDEDVDKIIQRKIWLADYLDANDINYTGSNSQAHKLELYKDKAKERVSSFNINTASFYVSGRLRPNKDIPNLRYPLFVKPLNSGGGNGIDSSSLVHDRLGLDEKVQNIHDVYKSDAMIEEYLPGREFTVGIFRKALHNDGYECMPLELLAPLDESGVRILTAQVKESKVETPAVVVEENVLRLTLERFALQVFKSLGARDYGRIDIRLSETDEPYFLEANLIPGIIDGSGNFSKACAKVLGLDYEEMIMGIIGLAAERDMVTA